MPVVPFAPSVAPSSGGSLPYQSSAGATPEAFGASVGVARERVGAAQQQLGAQTAQVGDMLAKHAIKMQDDINVAHAEDLFLRGDTELSQLTEQFNGLQGADRVNALPKYIEDATALRGKLRDDSPNADVARKVDQLFTRQLGYSIKDAGRLSATANRQYMNEKREAVRTNSLQKIAANADDDNRFKSELDVGLQTFRESDEYKGSAPEVREAHDQAYTSSAWATRLQAMAKTDPLRARELFTANKGSIDGLTAIKISDAVDTGIVNVQSRVEADDIVRNGALVSPELRERVKKLEGYRAEPYKDFKQTSSGYGTKYEEGDKALPPDTLRKIHEERLDRDLGRAANIVDTFAPGLPAGTRDALISLTYNSGTAWTTSSLGAKVRAGDFEGAKTNFAQYTNAGGETNAGLVGRRGEELGWWGGEPTDTSGDRMTGMLAKAKESSIRLFPDDPQRQSQYLDMLQSRIKSDYSVMRTAAKDMLLDNRNTVYAELLTPDHRVTKYEDLTPKAQQAYDLMPPEQQGRVQKAMNANATADVPHTPERQSNADKLYGDAMNNPDKFMATDITEQDITRTDKSRFLKMQADKKGILAKGAALQKSMSYMSPTLQAAGITRKDNIEEYNKFSGVFAQEIERREQEQKKPLSEKETRELGASLLKDVVLEPGGRWFGFRDRTGPMYEKLLEGIPRIDKTMSKEEQTRAYENIPVGGWFLTPDGERLQKKARDTVAAMGIRG